MYKELLLEGFARPKPAHLLVWPGPLAIENAKTIRSTWYKDLLLV